jgi:hypothetical protein
VTVDQGLPTKSPVPTEVGASVMGVLLAGLRAAGVLAVSQSSGVLGACRSPTVTAEVSTTVAENCRSANDDG